jgi:CelD/BcsL family acetyltransferase involved in cellulose biosynthesis
MTATASPPGFSVSTMALDSASSMIASVRRASAADRRSAAAFEVECRPLAALEPIAAAWRELAAHSVEANIFYDPAFALSAAPLLGNDIFAGLVWSGSAPRQLLGFFPVRIDRRRYGVPIPVLVGWTHRYAPLGTPLVRRDMAEAVIAAWLDHVAEDPALPDLLLMPLLAEDGPFAAALGAVLAHSGRAARSFGRHQRAMLAPAGDRAGYADAALGAKKRKELRRQRRRLEDVGEAQWSVAKDAGEVASALDDFLALEAAGWKGSLGTAAAHHADVRGFITRAITQLAGEGKVAIFRLCINNNAIAAIVALRSGEAAWLWKTAYDEAFAHYSPGVLLAVATTEALLADPALAYADSCATPDHPMIDHIWRERGTLADQLIGTGSEAEFSFVLAGGLEALRRTALAAAKSLRELLRRG